jgi:hypothetical protein
MSGLVGANSEQEHESRRLPGVSWFRLSGHRGAWRGKRPGENAWPQLTATILAPLPENYSITEWSVSVAILVV